MCCAILVYLPLTILLWVFTTDEESNKQSKCKTDIVTLGYYNFLIYCIGSFIYLVMLPLNYYLILKSNTL